MKAINRISGFACIVASALILNSTDLFAWGQKGHDITCAVAREHLTKKAAKKIDQILDGKSIVYWSSWMDNASHTPEFAYTKTWHYKNIDADEAYETAYQEPAGDVLTAIEAQIAALKSGTLNKEAQALALKMLVHFVGDLHCPMHMAHRSDRGGNSHQVQFFNQSRNLHSIWDSGIIDNARKWTYTEWAQEIDTVNKKEIEAIVAGTPAQWGKETFEIATRIYEGTPKGSKLSYDYVNEWSPVVEQQLLAGGLRLAKILNEIFK